MTDYHWTGEKKPLMAANAIRDDGDDMVDNVDVVGALGAILVKGS
jgi:hypothetical protein